jgi:CheY-like chemotaxis protein
MTSGRQIYAIVVDDHPEHAEYLKELLERAGYAARAFCSARGALQFLCDQDVRLVVTDVFMAEMDGIEFMRAVKQLRPAVPVMAVCGGRGTSDELFLSFMMKLGAAYAFAKPVCVTSFLQAAHDLIRGPAADAQSASDPVVRPARG